MRRFPGKTTRANIEELHDLRREHGPARPVERSGTASVGGAGGERP
ncbi:hypothetical protein R2F25_14415 [Streptomyces sp. UP1A-1]|nr:hypothetical protein [Streptomyces sp. UP1A-1]